MEFELGWFLSIAALIAGGICLWKSTQCAKEKKALISTHVIEGMLTDNFELLEYNSQKTFSAGQLKDSQLQGWRTRTGNDFFQARYKGVSFACSDVQLIDRNDKTPVFKGQWFILDLRKAFPTPLMISELERRHGIAKEVPLQTEKTSFATTVAVLTESPELAPKVLTPAFTDFLLTLRPRSPDRSLPPVIHLFFEGRQAHFGLHTYYDSFEPCQTARDIPALRARVQGEIDCIKSILDGFLLLGWLFEGEQSDEDAEKRDLYARLVRSLANRVSE